MLQGRDIFTEIMKEVQPVMDRVNQAQLEAATSEICKAGTIFVSGMGRSGYMMRCFAMRLMQMGLNACMVGDTSTSCAKENDLLIIGSGSGETASLKNYAAKAKKLGCRTLVLTGHPESTLGQAADCLVWLPVEEELHKDESGAMLIYETENSGTKMLLGSRIELCMLLVTEALCMMTFEHMGFSEADMMRRHACFE